MHGVNSSCTTGTWPIRCSWSNSSTSCNPTKSINLGAQSHVRVSFDIPEYTADITGVGTIRILEAIREAGVRTPVLPGFKQ